MSLWNVKKRPLAFIVAACLASALLVVACSRNASPPAARADASPTKATGGADVQPSSTVATENRPVIVAFGDSLTAGVAGRSYPDDLQDLLDQHGYAYRVDNQGVSGDTTTDGLARIDNVIGQHPALVLLEFGGNDGLRGVPVDAIQQNLEKMIAQLKQAKIPFVLLGITLPPNYGADYVKSFTAMYPSLAKKYNLKFVPFLLLHVYQNPDLMQPDGIHPSGAGNKIVAQDVFSLIQPLLKRRITK
jgi:acyl-CoA thioesterase I